MVVSELLIMHLLAEIGFDTICTAILFQILESINIRCKIKKAVHRVNLVSTEHQYALYIPSFTHLFVVICPSLSDRWLFQPRSCSYIY